MASLEHHVVVAAALSAAAAAGIYFYFVQKDQNKTVRSTTASGSGGQAAAGSGPLVYETNRAVFEYLQFHYASKEEMLPYNEGAVPGLPTSALHFTKRLAAECRAGIPSAGRSGTRALDLGCAVGGASFELSKDFEYVKGIDYSHAFIAAANEMKRSGHHKYEYTVQSEISQQGVAELPPGVSQEDSARVHFEQGDACCLPADLGQFDAVLCANLLCRLPRPRALLEHLPSLVKKGGVVVIVSPYSWLLEYTPKKEWLGGYSRSGQAVESSDEVALVMQASGFSLVEQKDMPFLIREHARKFQLGISDATVWRRT